VNSNDFETLIEKGDSIRINRQAALYPAALALYRKAIELRPDSAAAHHKAGLALKLLGKDEESKASVLKALELDPGFIRARFSLLDAFCPIIYETEEAIESCRISYDRTLTELSETLDLSDDSTVIQAAKTVGYYPFYLGYQGFDDLELQKKFGNLVCGIQAARYPRFTRPVPLLERRPGDPVRVGIVSGFFRNHSAFKFPVKSWIMGLDKKKFTLSCYHTGLKSDTETDWVKKSCSRFVEGEFSMERLAEKILADRQDILIYPEIGMNGLSIRLASLRLAPVQCAAWGHTTTTGLPTMDYYLSSDLMEPEDGKSHYSEKLIRLSNLSFFHIPPNLKEFRKKTRTELGLRDDSVIYLCIQSLFKYLPSYDEILARIAVNVPKALFIFLEGRMAGPVVKKMKNRLQKAFRRHGLDSSNHSVFLPFLEDGDYHSLLLSGDVFLDSVGWSGCNTTMDAVAHDVPVVTFPGNLMRGRQTMAILAMMGVTETIAESVGHYIYIASHLGNDVEKRKYVKNRIASNKHLLEEDRSCIRSLSDFLENAALNNGEN
jgi:predicted O-linked N-acetylglucosamine transferase (SPINDLY family)